MNLEICTKIGDLLINKEIKNEGLMYGKSGVSIFFYNLAKEIPNKKYKEYADTLIDDVFKKSSLLTNFKDGVAGIGWCIEYLIQNDFCKGRTDEILESIDLKIFKILNEQNEISFGLQNGLIGYLQYITIRLKNKHTYKSNEAKINIELLKLIINKIDPISPYKFIDLTKDIGFNILEDIYILLLSLCEIFELNIYNDKISNMLKQWESYLISYLPSIHFNRLYLAIILFRVNKIIKSEKTNRHIRTLLYSIDSKTLKSEVDFKNIQNVCIGYLGLLFILNISINTFDISYPNYSLLTSIKHEIKELCHEKFITKLEQEEINSKDGIVEGWAGAGLLLLLVPGVLNKK